MEVTPQGGGGRGTRTQCFWLQKHTVNLRVVSDVYAALVQATRCSENRTITICILESSMNSKVWLGMVIKLD